MSVVAITIAIVAIIALCVCAIYIAQARERVRIEKIRKIKGYSDRHERLQGLLHELPPQYLTDELRSLIIQQSINTANNLVALKKSSRYEGYLQADQEYLTQLQSKQLSLTPMAIKGPEHAIEVKRLMEILFKFVQQQAKQGLIDPGKAKTYLSQIKYGAVKSKTDGFVDKANQAVKNGKPRVAIHAYHTAIEALKSIADYPQAAADISAFRQEIKQLEQTADQHNQEVKAKAQQASVDKENKGEWDEFLGDDDEWKKKNTYDD